MSKDPDYSDENISQEESDDELEDGLWKEDIEVVARKKSKKTRAESKSAAPKVATESPSIVFREAQVRCLDFAKQGSTDGLVLKKVTRDKVCNVNLLSDIEKKGLAKARAKARADIGNIARGLRPLEEYYGEDEQEKRMNRTLSNYMLGCKGIDGNEAGHPLNQAFTKNGNRFKYGVDCFEISGSQFRCKICDTYFDYQTTSTHLAQHAFGCKTSIENDECQWCGKSEFGSKRHKLQHLSLCQKGYQSLLPKLDELRIVHTIEPSCKQAMRDGHKSDWMLGTKKKNFTLKDLQDMNDDQGCPLGDSDSLEAIEKMNKIRQGKTRYVVQRTIQVYLGLIKQNGIVRGYGGLIKDALVNFGFKSSKYPMNQK